MVMPPFTIIIFINVTSLSLRRAISAADERISLIGNTDAGTKANYIESILPPSPPFRLSLFHPAVVQRTVAPRAHLSTRPRDHDGG